MNLASLLTTLGFALVAMAQYDSPCGSAKTCISNCPHKDFFPMIDSCEMGDDDQPECYVNFYCAQERLPSLYMLWITHVS
ncbi:hypothetical protein BJY00DRAFT_312376 [Aspergillus carlsbadensis]|nr:hypothetical protein BJY00DRAFT_312376 [Aspergillus carlsbadensis]